MGLWEQLNTKQWGNNGYNALDTTENGPSAVLAKPITAWGVAADPTKKVIGFTGSVVIFVNAIIGPGIVTLPKLFAQNGYAFPTLLLVCGFLISMLATVVRCDTIALMPGNREFTRMVEFSEPVLMLVGERAYYVAHFMFYVSAMVTAISSVAMVSMAFDVCVAKFCGSTWALVVGYGEGAMFVRGVSWDYEANCEYRHVCQPFTSGSEDPGGYYLSLGYLVTSGVLYPLGRIDISGGMGLQYASFLVLVVTLAGMIAFALANELSALGFRAALVKGEQYDAAGLIIFNLMYGVFVSTWLTEKRPDVSVQKVVQASVGPSCALMLLYAAVFGAYSGNTPQTWNSLVSAMAPGMPLFLTFSAIFFSLFVIASGVPMACIMSKENLRNSSIQIVSEPVAVFVSTALPFLIGWLFYSFTLLNGLMNATGILFTSWLALVLPFFLQLALIAPLPGDGAYFTWLIDHFRAPPDENGDTVLSPLPERLRPHTRKIYATILTALSIWIIATTALFWRGVCS